MILPPEFKNSGWRLIISRYEPRLPSNKILDLGFHFSSEYLIAKISSNNQLDTWQAAGKVWATSLINATETSFFSKNLDLANQELIYIPKVVPGKYSLFYRAPKHFTNVRIKIWEYRGIIPIEPDIPKSLIDSLVSQNAEITIILQELLDKVNNCTQHQSTLTLEQKAIISHFIL